jgi:hypothetical protein
MNQTQRDFLIQQVKNACEQQCKKLQKQMPDKPSLNNYLIAAFLDKSIKFADIDVLKNKMRKAVIKFGTDDLLVDTNSRSRWNDDDDDDGQEFVKVDPSDLFIIPKAYTEALAEFNEKKKEIEDKIERLEGVRDTITLKIQIGSAGHLEKIVMQVDNMGDLNLINTQLLLDNKSS